MRSYSGNTTQIESIYRYIEIVIVYQKEKTVSQKQSDISCTRYNTVITILPCVIRALIDIYMMNWIYLSVWRFKVTPFPWNSRIANYIPSFFQSTVIIFAIAIHLQVRVKITKTIKICKFCNAKEIWSVKHSFSRCIITCHLKYLSV